MSPHTAIDNTVDPFGSLVFAPPDHVINCFASYYWVLYTSRVDYEPNALTQYLNDITFPTLSLTQCKHLESPISVEELQSEVVWQL